MAGEAVMVTDAGLGSAVAVIRSLDRAGYRVIAADARPGCPGMVSRHASARWVYPPPEEDPRAFMDNMEQAAIERNTQASADLAGQVEAWMDKNSRAMLTCSRMRFAMPSVPK